MTKDKKSKDKSNTPIQYRLKKIEIQKLKGISDCKIEFSLDKKITAIMGINGSGKSTIIHALSCCYRPKNSTSKDHNKFSDFFTPHSENNWQDSGFNAYFYCGEIKYNNNKKCFEYLREPKTTFSVKYNKVKRWMPVYERRPIKESIYLGLQTLGTLSDNISASRYATYESKPFEPANIKVKILNSMNKVLGADYSDLMICTSKKNKSGYSFLKFTKNNTTYTEHTMGAGEKRVYEVLRAAYDPSLHPNGILLIDELDVLLHERAFKNLINELIEIANNSFLEIIFSTHRESVIQFKELINIVSIFNFGTGVKSYPGVSANTLKQLSDIKPELLNIYVEDNLAFTVVKVFLERELIAQKVNIGLFGSAQNSAAVLSGLILTVKNVDNVMCILDGDIFTTDKEKQKIISQHLSGTDKRKEREKIFSRIFEFKLPKECLNKKGSPEFTHKKWFEAIELDKIPASDKNEFIQLQQFSLSIQGLSDWHNYYDILNEHAQKMNIEYLIIGYISKYSPFWDDYICDIKNEIIKKLSELN